MSDEQQTPEPNNPEPSGAMKNIMDKPTEPSKSGEDQRENTGPAPAGYFTTPLPLPDLATTPLPRLSPEPAFDNDTPVTHDSPVTAVPVRHQARVGTIVWGAIIVALGLLIIVASQANLRLDAAQTAMWLLLGAGVAMVAGGAINLLRKK